MGQPRYECDPVSRIFVINTLSGPHEKMTLDTVEVHQAQLRNIAAVSHVQNVGSRTIKLLDSSTKCPDTSFSNRQKGRYPVAVVETAYSQTSETLLQSAHKYIQHSAGEIQLVLTLT